MVIRLVTAAPVAALAAFLLAACVGPTPYQPAVKRDGFAESKIEGDRYRVTFRGNAQTSRETVETYLLYRAAELTLAEGRDWFRITHSGLDTDTEYRTYGSPFVYQPFLLRPRRYGYFGDPFYSPFYGYDGVRTRPIRRYEAYATIRIYDGEKPASDDKAYDAREIIANLGPKIVRPEPGS